MLPILSLNSNEVRSIRDFGLRVVELLAPEVGESILDLGCGDGRLSALLQTKGAKVVGIDIDANAVSSAKANGIDARVQDAQTMSFDNQFDAVFSHASVHLMPETEKVFAGSWRALKPNGRFVAETGSHRHIAAIHTAMIATALHFNVPETRIPAYYCPPADECCDLLEASGYAIEDIRTVAMPAPLPRGVLAWFEMFGTAFFDLIEPSRRVEAMLYAEKLLIPVLRTRKGDWIADYVHMRFKARKRAL